jgi:hypothetical protein
MDIETKCEIIEEFMRDFSSLPETYNNNSYLDFRVYNDLGVPLAQAYVYKMAELTDEGKQVINETWNNFCSLFSKNPDNEYKDLSMLLNSDSI